MGTRSWARHLARATFSLVAGTAVLAVAAPASAGATTGGGPRVHANSAPVFTSKTAAKAKQGKPLSFTVKTKATPTATISVTGALPPGVTFTDNGNGTGRLSDPTPLGGTYTIGLHAANTIGTADQTLTLTVSSKLPLLRHVFVIMLENNDYSATFGNPAQAPYLASTLTAQGTLLKNYDAVGHFSNDNYTAFLSGQPPNTDNQLDCANYSNFPAGSPQVNGIQQGLGCVYPSGVSTLADQLAGDGLTWKGYMEDMGNDPTRDGGITCAHPTIGSTDGAFAAEASDGYATRHNPFVYFHSIIDNATECNNDVVPLGDTAGAMPSGTPAGVTGLATDLQSVSTTPNFSFITPNLCDDGHDNPPCKNATGAGQGGGSSPGDIDKWLQTWVPIITSSAAYQQDGLLLITSDEAEQPALDTTSCCGETAGPNADNGNNGISGPGGGVVGALLLSPKVAAGVSVTKTSYNHYSALASIEDLFGLPRLGEAGTVTTTFDKHIYTK